MPKRPEFDWLERVEQHPVFRLFAVVGVAATIAGFVLAIIALTKDGGRRPKPFVRPAIQVRAYGDSAWHGSNFELQPGKRVEYQFRFVNTGPDPVRGLSVRAKLGPYIAYVPGSCLYLVGSSSGPHQCSDAFTAQGIDLGGLNGHAAAYVKIVVDVADRLGGRTRLETTVASPETDPFTLGFPSAIAKRS